MKREEKGDVLEWKGRKREEGKEKRERRIEC